MEDRVVRRYLSSIRGAGLNLASEHRDILDRYGKAADKAQEGLLRSLAPVLEGAGVDLDLSDSSIINVPGEYGWDMLGSLYVSDLRARPDTLVDRVGEALGMGVRQVRGASDDQYRTRPVVRTHLYLDATNRGSPLYRRWSDLMSGIDRAEAADLHKLLLGAVRPLAGVDLDLLGKSRLYGRKSNLGGVLFVNERGSLLSMFTTPKSIGNKIRTTLGVRAEEPHKIRKGEWQVMLGVPR